MAERVCPVWIGYLLASPLRKLLYDPRKLLEPYVKMGMTVLDIGSAMGFFSLPMAELAGPGGKVICVDLQEQMIMKLKRRAEKAGLAERIQTRVCPQTSLGLDDLRGAVDFALAFAMVHEVPDGGRLLSEVHATLKSGGTLLMAEPRGHVTPEKFEATVSAAVQSGFEIVGKPIIRLSHAVLLSKK
jgi:2-polyprenyl-3-methyl-5-hydroxy-6-metoxy-1,4-benzoquinol methylase